MTQSNPSPTPQDPEPVHLTTQFGIQVMHFRHPRMDGQTVRQMYELTVQTIYQPNARLLIDLTGVEYVSSAGLGMFVTLRKKCLGVGAQMHLLVPDPLVMDMFKVMRLEMILPLYAELGTALRRFKPPAG